MKFSSLFKVMRPLWGLAAVSLAVGCGKEDGTTGPELSGPEGHVQQRLTQGYYYDGSSIPGPEWNPLERAYSPSG